MWIEFGLLCLPCAIHYLDRPSLCARLTRRWQVFYYIFFSVCTLTVLFMVIRPYFRKAKPKTAAEAIALR
jgi:hypothetical protein